jgi:hypothetical protein
MPKSRLVTSIYIICVTEREHVEFEAEVAF